MQTDEAMTGTRLVGKAEMPGQRVEQEAQSLAELDARHISVAVEGSMVKCTAACTRGPREKRLNEPRGLRLEPQWSKTTSL